MECVPTQSSAVFAAAPGMNCTQIPAHMIVRLDEVEARQKEIELARKKAEEERLQAERERLEALHRQQVEMERQKRKQELDAAIASLKAQYAAIDASLAVKEADVAPVVSAPAASQATAPAKPQAATIVAPEPNTSPAAQAEAKQPAKEARKSFGPVKSGASLNSIITRYDELSGFRVEDVAAAFVRINPSAFKTKNPSSLVSGSTLTIPLPSDVSQSKQEATANAEPRKPVKKAVKEEEAEVVEKSIPNALATPSTPAPASLPVTQAIPKEQLTIEPLKKADSVSNAAIQPSTPASAPATSSNSDARAQLLSEAQEIRRLIEEAKAAAKSGAAQ